MRVSRRIPCVCRQRLRLDFQVEYENHLYEKFTDNEHAHTRTRAVSEQLDIAHITNSDGNVIRHATPYAAQLTNLHSSLYDVHFVHVCVLVATNVVQYVPWKNETQAKHEDWKGGYVANSNSVVFRLSCRPFHSRAYRHFGSIVAFLNFGVNKNEQRKHNRQSFACSRSHSRDRFVFNTSSTQTPVSPSISFSLSFRSSYFYYLFWVAWIGLHVYRILTSPAKRTQNEFLCIAKVGRRRGLRRSNVVQWKNINV